MIVHQWDPYDESRVEDPLAHDGTESNSYEGPAHRVHSQESPKMEEFFRDFDWDLNRFVEYRSPFTRKETLPIKKPIYILGLELKLYLI
jgi:hypothetical protein